MSTFLGLAGILMFIGGAFACAGATMANQEIVGVLLIGFGVVAFGLGGIVDAIKFAGHKIERRLPEPPQSSEERPAWRRWLSA